MAAAYAALVSLSNNLELIQNHPRHSFSFDNDQITSLGEIVSFLIQFMASYDHSHGANEEAAQILERQIARAAHAVEDVVESHVVDQIRAGSTLPGNKTSWIPLDLQNEIDAMDFVRRKAIKVNKAQTRPTYCAAAASPSTPLAPVKNTMIGFDDVLIQLMDMLIGEPCRQVISVVGMGGIGKTTLATTAFEHSLVVRHFDLFLWATISQNYVVKDILQELLSSPRESPGGTVDELGEKLYKRLYGRRYLIILDDMWSVQVWDEIKLFLPNTCDGSRIVVTTRQSDVAGYLGSLCLAMSFLDEKKSWDLFCQKAFAEQGCPLEFEEVGKKIVRKCNGLPLAIVVVGGHLRKSSTTREYWENVANHMNSILNCREHEQVFDILSLSYSYLPVHLKPCFLYMGTFPEDQDILASDLIKLWIAEGFLTSSTTQSLEEIAESYLKDLIVRNLVVADRWSYNGKNERCRIHDILRELCRKIAEKEKFFCVLHTPLAIHRERRVVINGRIPDEKRRPKIFNALRSAPLVRSLKCNGGRLRFNKKFIRVLNKADCAFKNEDNEVFLDANYHQQLVNLRYLRVCLDYKSSEPIYLPPSISLLWNLQTIIFTVFPSIVIAPNEIWEMLQLRHFQVHRVCLPDPLPSDLALRNLLTLSNARNLRLSEEVCKRAPYIKELKVTYNNFGRECDEPKSYYYYYPHNLACFRKLESLACQFDRDPKWRDFTLCLAFPSSLKSLSLNGSRLRWEELTMMVGSLPNLETLRLLPKSVIGSSWTSVEGKFPRLNNLVINCYDLIYWKADRIHFPVLENLILSSLRKLDEFPCGIGEIPTLEHVILDGCSVSLAISAMKMLVEQEEQGNEGLQLQVSFGVETERKLESFNQKLEEDGLRSNNLHLYPNMYKILKGLDQYYD